MPSIVHPCSGALDRRKSKGTILEDFWEGFGCTKKESQVLQQDSKKWPCVNFFCPLPKNQWIIFPSTWSIPFNILYISKCIAIFSQLFRNATYVIISTPRDQRKTGKKKGPWLEQGDLLGMIPTQLKGDYVINHEIKIPESLSNNQDSMESIRPFFFSVAQVSRTSLSCPATRPAFGPCAQQLWDGAGEFPRLRFGGIPAQNNEEMHGICKYFPEHHLYVRWMSVWHHMMNFLLSFR